MTSFSLECETLTIWRIKFITLTNIVQTYDSLRRCEIMNEHFGALGKGKDRIFVQLDILARSLRELVSHYAPDNRGLQLVCLS